MKIEIDQYVDLRVPDPPRDAVDAKRGAIHEAVERSFKATADVRTIVRSDRQPKDVEARPVVTLEKARGEIGDPVLAKIGRDVADADLVVFIALAAPDQWLASGIIFAHPGPRASKLVLSRVFDREKGERAYVLLAASHRSNEMVALGLKAIPIAELQSALNAFALHRDEIRLERERLVVGRNSLVVALQLGKDVAATSRSLSVVGLERQRLVIGGQRLVGALQVEQNIAAAKPAFGQIGAERQRPFIGSHGFAMTFELR